MNVRPNGPVHGRREDRGARPDQDVVQRLGVVAQQPERHAGARVRDDGVEVHPGQGLPDGEGDRRRREDDRVGRAGHPAQPEVGLVEGGGALEVADLQGDEVGAGHGHSCLEVLAQQPGASNAELARATFVTPQAMHGVLRGLEERGLLSRPASAAHGRALPTELTAVGRRALRAASAEVRAVEDRMLAPLGPEDRRRLLAQLAACTGALAPAPDD